MAHPDLVARVEDWEILLELAHRGVSGFVTNDGQILNSPREMVALSRTGLTLIVTDGTGHDPLVANGLLQVYLGEIALAGGAGPIIFRLRKGGKAVLQPGRRVNELARHRNLVPAELHRSELAVIRTQASERRPHLMPMLAARLGL